MKKTILSAALLLSPSLLSASPAINNDWIKETEANLVGHVVDSESQQHLYAVEVQVVGTKFTTRTDKSGHYFFKDLPQGKYKLRFIAMGYEAIEKEILITPNSVQTINVEVKPLMQGLNDIVVSANRNATKRRLAASMVNVLDATLFDNTQSTNISQALNFQPGLRVENNCQNCGFSQVRINGLDGKYSQILIDSRPVFSALAGIYGLEHIPTNMIERVEVVRGGGSALFGASAVGGVINVITKEPIAPSASFSHQIRGLGGLSAFENVTNFNATYVTDNNRLGFTLFGQNRHRAGYDRDKDGFSETPQIDGRSVGMQSFFKFADNAKLTAEFHASDEFRRGGDKFHDYAHNAYIAEQLEHTNLTGGLNYTQYSADGKHRFQIYSSFADVKRKSYYGSGTPANELMDIIANPTTSPADLQAARNDLQARMVSYGHTNGLTWLAGAQYAYDFDHLGFMPAQLTAGVEYNHDKLHDISGYRKDYLRQKVNISSFFAQNEWKNEQWSILLGARLDKHSLISQAILSPRLSLRYNPTRNLVLRASYSTGFRAPQIFDEDLHVESAGGNSYQIINAPNLHEERSKSYAVSADWYHKLGEWDVNVTLEGFHTRLKDAFALQDGENIIVMGTSVSQKERINSTGSQVSGANLEARFAYHKIFSFQAGWTLQNSQYDDPQESGAEVVLKAGTPDEEILKDSYKTRRFLRTPNNYGYFVATYTPIKNFDIALNGTYTGTMIAPHNIITNDDGTLALDDMGRPYSRVDANRLLHGEGQTANTYGGRTLKTPSFFEMGLKLQYTIPMYKYYNLQLYAGVNNIFDAFQHDLDRGKDRDSAYIYGPRAPRSFFAGLKLNF